MTAKHEKLLSALLESPTIAGAAAVVGISESSATRALRDPEFRECYRAARRAVVGHALTHLQSACSNAVATLCAVCDDTEAPASSRVTAAKAILEMSLRAIEIEDMAARVDMLEVQMEQTQ
jgi:hypothetical protein